MNDSDKRILEQAKALLEKEGDSGTYDYATALKFYDAAKMIQVALNILNRPAPKGIK
jgi:hypothetical protein